jgi:hypothetical protein
LSNEERQLLLSDSSKINPHTTVLGWLREAIKKGISDGHFRVFQEGSFASEGVPMAKVSLLKEFGQKILDLRASSTKIRDSITGRMPKAYVHLMQLLSDFLIFFTPVANLQKVGPISLVFGSGVVALLYASIVSLSKRFLDPFSNEVKGRGGDPGVAGIEVATLMQEVNIASDSWWKRLSKVPQSTISSTLQRKASSAHLGHHQPTSETSQDPFVVSNANGENSRVQKEEFSLFEAWKSIAAKF